MDPEVTDEEIKKRFRQVGSSDIAVDLIAGIALEQITVTDCGRRKMLLAEGQ